MTLLIDRDNRKVIKTKVSLEIHDQYIAGLDCSSKSIHIVLLSLGGKYVTQDSFVNISGDMDARMYDLMNQFKLRFEQKDNFYKHIKVAVVENPIYVQNVKATVGISQVIGAAKEFLNFYTSVFGIDNKSWKKDVVGNGNASKELIKEFALTKWKEMDQTWGQDFFDAACIAFWGVRRFGDGR